MNLLRACKNLLMIEKGTLRDTNMELLRILAMLMIIMHHFAVHSGFTFSNIWSFNNLLITALTCGGRVGVDIFLLISGYYLIKKEIRLRHFLKVLCQVLFYAVAIVLFLKIFNVGPHLGLRDTIHYIFPIFKINVQPIYNIYWFAFTYLILMIWTPFLNKIMQLFSRDLIEKGLLAAAILWVILPTFINTDMALSFLAWFIYMYLVGGYIRFYELDKKLVAQSWGKYSVGAFVFLLCTSVLVQVLNLKFPILKINSWHLYEHNSLFVVLLSLCLFFYFLDLHLKPNKFINNMALTMFGVYLIHDHPIVGNLLWHDLFKNAQFTNSPYLFWHALWVIVTVFFVCAAIDWLRIIFVEKPLMQKCGGIIDSWQERMMALDIKKLFSRMR